ncbi:hypothetical protein ACGFOU_27105 [Streptomyces sp. NPDC048595]|uniref:hypothetical protein n=1 Tax=Streptomyces sp. NPDC048595 TaxID=3365576 RepID=UPI0037182696
MKRTPEPEAVVARLWQEHLRAPFPAALRGAEAAGVDMVLLDADTAGCVSVWLDNGGSLDAGRRGTLRDRLAELDRALPLLSAPGELRYCQRLRRLAQLVSDAGPQPAG